MGAAHGGQVVMSESTAALVRDDLPPAAALLDLGEHRFRDVDGMMHVFQLDHSELLADFPPLRSVASSVGKLPVQLTSFVGRRSDLVRCGRRARSGAPRDAHRSGRRREDALGHRGRARARRRGEVVRRPRARRARRRRGRDRDDPRCRPIGANLSLEQAVHEALVGAARVGRARQLRACARRDRRDREPLVTGVPGHGRARHEPRSAGRARRAHRSGAPLDVDGDDDGAVALFVARAEAGGALLGPDDREAIVEICTRLDGMPLAIELAAARCATLGVDGVLDALGDRLLLLARARGTDERHRSLRAVLDWSHSLLDERGAGGAAARCALPRLLRPEGRRGARRRRHGCGRVGRRRGSAWSGRVSSSTAAIHRGRSTYRLARDRPRVRAREADRGRRSRRRQRAPPGLGHRRRRRARTGARTDRTPPIRRSMASSTTCGPR